jgi:hypothetical protein
MATAQQLRLPVVQVACAKSGHPAWPGRVTLAPIYR